MTELAKSDIFFLITSIAVVILGLMAAVVLGYVYVIVKDVKSLIDIIKDESEEVVEDIREFRSKLKSEQAFVRKIPALLMFIGNVFDRRRKRRKKAEREEDY